MFTVIVWDDRDTEATEPESQLGSFYTLDKAQKALADYLKTDNGKHIYRHRIEERD